MLPNSKSLAELMSLKGRVSVITGGAGHIGSVAADGLAELGSSIAVLDLRQDAAIATATLLAQKWGVEAEGFGVDLENADAIAATVEAIRTRFGRVDTLVNCAAFVGTSGLTGWAVPFEQQSIETWRRALEVNLTAPFALTQLLTPDLRARKTGSIINVASIYALVGPVWSLYEGTEFGNPAGYAASKGGLVQLTRWLSTTLAPDVRVNAIAPGGVFRNTAEPFQSRYVARTPMGRMGTEEDMKGAVAFLASDLSSYVTGQCLAVDGGWTAW